jgi:hypothetical protein
MPQARLANSRYCGGNTGSLLVLSIHPNPWHCAAMWHIFHFHHSPMQDKRQLFNSVFVTHLTCDNIIYA